MFFYFFLFFLNFFNYTLSELSCKDLKKIDSFYSISQFSSNEETFYVEEIKYKDIGKLLIKNGNEKTEIYYREKNSYFILYQDDFHKCKQEPLIQDKDFYISNSNKLIFVYNLQVNLIIGPSAIWQKFTANTQEWNSSHRKEKNLNCLVCQKEIESLAGLTKVNVEIVSKVENNNLVPFKIKLSGLDSEGKIKIYIVDYFDFLSLNEKNAVSQSYLKKSSLHLPLTGCPEAKFFGSLKFSLFLPKILEIKINYIESYKNSGKFLIYYDDTQKSIRVEDQNLIEIADLMSKNFFQIEKGSFCSPFYNQLNMSPNLIKAINLIKLIYSLNSKDFIHAGFEILEKNIKAQVFESVQIENKNKNVLILYTTEYFNTDEKDTQFVPSKLVSKNYQLNDKGNYVLTSLNTISIDNYKEIFYDDFYRLLFDIRSCVNEIYDSSHFGLKLNIDLIEDKKVIDDLKNKKIVLEKLTDSISKIISISRMSVNYLNYLKTPSTLLINGEIINTYSYLDSFIEYEDSVFKQNLVETNLNDCALKSYDKEKIYYGFRYCSFKDKIQKGMCFLVDDEKIFQKTKILNYFQHFNKKIYNSKTDLNEDVSCSLFKKASEVFKNSLVSNLSKLKNAVQNQKLYIEFEIDKNDEPEKTEKLYFKEIDISFNEKLFSFEIPYKEFDFLVSKKKFEDNYVTKTFFSSSVNLRTLFDCYSLCISEKLKNNKCDSFSFCIDPSTSLLECQLSSVNFKNNNLLSNSDGVEPQNYFKDSEMCKVYKLLYTTDLKIYPNNLNANQVLKSKKNTISEFFDLTLEECSNKCLIQTKDLINFCRTIEYCSYYVVDTDNKLFQKSLCRTFDKEVRQIKKVLNFGKNCQVLEWKYLKDFYIINKPNDYKSIEHNKLISLESCAKLCSNEPFCQKLKFCSLDQSLNKGNCFYESNEERSQVFSESSEIKCFNLAKNLSPRYHQDLILPSETEIKNYRKTLIYVSNEKEVKRVVFFNSIIITLVLSILIMFIVGLVYNKMYKNQKDNPQQLYTTFNFYRSRFGC